MEKLNKKDLKVIKDALEWCVEDNCECDDIGIGKTHSKKIFKVLKKL